MGTRFEIFIPGRDGPDERAAGEAALDEIGHFDAALDLFRADSYLSHVNRRAHEKPVRLDGDLFELFTLCQDVSRTTDGAFDITVGALMTLWGFHGGAPAVPADAALDGARERVGFSRVILDPEAFTVRFDGPGVRLDFGAVAKGFALDRAGAILREAGVDAALLHGGTSTIKALGSPPGQRAWKVGVRDPEKEATLVRVVHLSDRAFSVSAPKGRIFRDQDRSLGHIMDPLSGAPAQGAALAAVVGSSAARVDAWSTALCVSGPSRFRALMERAEDLSAFICWSTSEGLKVDQAGPGTKLFRDPGS